MSKKLEKVDSLSISPPKMISVEGNNDGNNPILASNLIPLKTQYQVLDHMNNYNELTDVMKEYKISSLSISSI